MAGQLQTPLQSILNFRDVSEYVNKATNTKRLKTGLLYRSARPGNIVSTTLSPKQKLT
jgi:hypothetical protein